MKSRASAASNQRQSKSVRIGKGQQPLAEARGLRHFYAVASEALGPINQAPGWNRQGHLDGEAYSGLARRHVRPGEERQIGAGMGGPVGVEEMVRPRHVLVDGLLYQPHPHDSNVEVEILLRIPSDDRDVM